MNQLTMQFDARKRVRRGDPVSSQHAALNAEKFAASHGGKIIQALKDHGAMSASEIARWTDLNSVQVNRRLHELEKKQLIARCTANFRSNQNGCLEQVWRVER